MDRQKTQEDHKRHMDIDARKPVLGVCEQQRCRSACTSMQTDQCLCYLLIGKFFISFATSKFSS